MKKIAKHTANAQTEEHSVNAGLISLNFEPKMGTQIPARKGLMKV